MKFLKRLLQAVTDENQYIKDNVKYYATLNKMDKIIIYYMVNGHNDEFICRILSITADELEKRKHDIGKKLHVTSGSELKRFSVAFNLKDLKDVRYEH
jgi:FixJ family two-component response regulator